MKLKTIGIGVSVAIAALAIGWSGASDAKGMKKPAEQKMVFCPMIWQQVCGAKGGMKFSYANSCFATRDGATVVGQGACKPGKAMKAGKAKKKKMSKKKKKM